MEPSCCSSSSLITGFKLKFKTIQHAQNKFRYILPENMIPNIRTVFHKNIIDFNVPPTASITLSHLKIHI